VSNLLKMRLVRIALVAASLAAVAGKLSPLGLADGGL
jgi:hypothetical protein